MNRGVVNEVLYKTPVEIEIWLNERTAPLPDCGFPLECDYSSIAEKWVCERCGFEHEEDEF